MFSIRRMQTAVGMGTILVTAVVLALPGCTEKKKDPETGEERRRSYPEVVLDSRDLARYRVDETTTKGILRSIRMFKTMEDRYPESFEELMDYDASVRAAIYEEGEPRYTYVSGIEPDAPSDTIIIYESRADSHDKRYAGLVSGEVVLLGEEKFRQKLASQQ